MELTAIKIRQAAQIALVLEPLLDKEGCTTRYTDLQEKPLKDFLIAAINVGEAIEFYAESVLNGNERIFSSLAVAMDISNYYKSEKNINFGLLVFIFMAIRARIISHSPQEAIETMVKQLEHSTNADVKDYMEGWRKNISTTTKVYKTDKTNENTTLFDTAPSLKVLFERGLAVFAKPELTGYQFCSENINDYPLLAKFITEIDENIGVIASLENTYKSIHQGNSALSVGMLADLSAVALFLHISFKNPAEYKLF